MQQQAGFNLPEAIKNDISIYLAPEEKLLKAIRSGAERTASKGQVWLILSSRSVFFHTCETGKEPVIALLSRQEIREIEYFQRADEVLLTFIPARNPQNITRLNFSNSQRPALEDFCDDLADLINFKKETAAGVKTYSSSTTVKMPVPAKKAADTPASALRSTASAVKHSSLPPAETRAKIEPVAPLADKPEIKPEVKIVKTPVSAEPDKPVKRPAASGGEKVVAEIRVGYIVAATVISVLVGFLWYKFFSSLTGMDSRS